MPSRSEHIAKAEANEEAVRFLENDHPDWAVTALFYAAVHWVDAVLDGIDEVSIHPKQHRQRRRGIARQPELRTIAEHYRALQDASVVSADRAQATQAAVVAALNAAAERIESITRRLNQTITDGGVPMG